MKHYIAFFLFISLASFTNAQNVCDELNLVSIGYSPFTDTVIVVSVENNNATEIFDYPGFVLIHTNGDTVAREGVNYFGIGAQSVHTLQVSLGAHNPIENFNGVLQLYSGFYNDFECEWQLNETLCTENECDSMILAFENYGGALVLGDFAWSLLDSTEAVLESGTFTMEAQGQYWEKRMCLPKGMYSYTLEALGQPTGGGPTMTASTSPWYLAPIIQQDFDWNAENVMEIPFYLHCIAPEEPNRVEAAERESGFIVSRTEGQVVIEHTEVMQTVEIIGLDGKLIASFNPKQSAFTIPSTLKAGICLISVRTEDGISTIKVVL
jgi:hypothetical protein